METFISMFTNGNGLAVLGAVLAIILAGVGSARGVGIAGEAAGGIVAEDPNKFVQCLVLQALPGTQGIYGFLIGIIIINNMGFFSGNIVTLDTMHGFGVLLGALPVGIVGLISAVSQGRVAISGMGIVAKRPDKVANGLIYAAMVETYAILAFLGSFLIVSNILK